MQVATAEPPRVCRKQFGLN